MRHIFILILTGLLLTGCASAPQPPEPVSTIPTTQTTSPATQPETIPEETIPEETRLPEDPIESLMNVMSTEEKVGQLFLARCSKEIALQDLQQYHLGGYILFGRDFQGQTPDTLRKTLASYQNAAPIPLLIAVDEEGGTVCRVSSNAAFRSRRFPSPREAMAAGGMEAVLAAETEKAALLRDLGINVNMGPVCDITTGFGAFMHDRSLGESPEETSRFVANTVRILENHNIGSVLKHFPGYGNNADTHTDIVRDERSLEELEQVDLLPFAAGIDSGCGAILMSHNIVTALDDTSPATLSPAVHQYLRAEMGFDGVIVTDDLVMQAITDSYGAGESAVLAFLAGNDLLCSTEYAVQYTAVLEAVESGRISEELLNSAVYRILSWKKNLGLIF